MNILGHAPFIGTTGYANHARSFFCALNKYHTVKIRNLTIGGSWGGMNNRPHDGEPYFTEEMENMLILQTLHTSDGNGRIDEPMYNYKGDFVPDVHIILMETNNFYFYEDYVGYKIAYNVWESTRYPDEFFNRLFYFDEVWVPTQWQFDCLVEQGYPREKIYIVPEGVDVDTFKPVDEIPETEKIRFVHFGRWDYRKGTTEILQAFSEEFKDVNDVELLASVENPYPFDGMSSTEERIKHYNIDTNKIKFLKFPPRDEYIKYLQNSHVFISCARSEGWNLPLIESMSCGTPSIYSDWGGQLQFAKDKGIPVKIKNLRPANIEHKEWPGEYCEPDWNDLRVKMRYAYNNHETIRKRTLIESKDIHENFNWDIIARESSKILQRIDNPLVFVTTGNINYMSVIEKLVKSLSEFSKYKIIVYGVDCDVPFDYPNLIKRKISPPKHSEHDRWYWKQYACIESLKENYENFVWIDGDVIVNYNIDNVKKYFKDVTNYPLSDIHRQEEFSGKYYINGEEKTQLFNENISKLFNVDRFLPFMHVCMFIYNKNCKWWFEEIISTYKSINLNEYTKYLLWNDEGIDNVLRWKYGFKKHLPLSNFDTSSYDGDIGWMNNQLKDFYTFWNVEGPYNFNRVYGFQYVPKDKTSILYFHGNKIDEMSDNMIQFIKMKRDNSFYEGEWFYTSKDILLNLGEIKDVHGSTMDIAYKYGWPHAIYHEIYNLQDYYLNRIKRINEGDIVVDLGGNIGVFNRWAYSQGASKVISFEPDKRYFEMLSMNANPKSVLFNAAMSDKVGTIELYESDHLGGSNVFVLNSTNINHYPVRTYCLDYFFDVGYLTKIDFLKVDIEGAEILVFKGISDENLSKINNIAIEYHHSHLQYNEELRHDLITRLNKLGFNSYILFLGDNNALQLIYFWK